MEQSRETTAAGAEQTVTGPMLMVVTLKSGVQIRTHVSEYTIGKYRTGGLARLRWTATEDTEAAPEYLDMDEVAAVHTEWPKAS